MGDSKTSDMTGKLTTNLFNSDKFNTVEYNDFEGGTYSVSYGRSDIAMARTLIHEAIHAKLGSEGVTIKDNHEMMAAPELRQVIVEGLKQYAKEANIEYTDKELNSLSWGGLEGTDAFKSLSKDEQKEITTTNQKLSESVNLNDE